ASCTATSPTTWSSTRAGTRAEWRCRRSWELWIRMRHPPSSTAPSLKSSYLRITTGILLRGAAHRAAPSHEEKLHVLAAALFLRSLRRLCPECRHGGGACRCSGESRRSGGHHGVSARQRAARAAVPRPVKGNHHRQHDLSRRITPRELRRNRHGASAGTHAVQ